MTIFQDPDRALDLYLIEQTVLHLEDAQNMRDPEAFLALFAADPVWVTAFGRRLTGMAEIAGFTRQVLTPAIADHFARYEIAHITFLAETVVAVNVRQRPVHADGTAIAEEEEGSPLYVLVKENDRWRIAIGQNTKVQGAAIAEQTAALEAAE